MCAAPCRRPARRPTVDIVEVEFPAGARVSFPPHAASHGMTQHVWVFEGEMEMTTGETVHRLVPGDCLFMPVGEGHVFHNPHHQARPLLRRAQPQHPLNSFQEQIMTVIRFSTHNEARAAIPDLCEILADCVEGGASVGFMQPYTPADAEPYWRGVAEAVEAGVNLLVGGGSRRQDRRHGPGRLGLDAEPAASRRPEETARASFGARQRPGAAADGGGRTRSRQDTASTLLVLDTATGSDAEAIYPRLGWERVGVIPDYAMWPEGGYCATTLFYKRIAA